MKERHKKGNVKERKGTERRNRIERKKNRNWKKSRKLKDSNIEQRKRRRINNRK